MGGTRSLFVLAAFAAMVITTAVPADAAGIHVPRDGSPPIAVKSHRVTVTVTDGLASTTLRQTFVNPHSRALEAIYLFPVPTDAALVDLAMEVGGQRLEGLLAERKQARRVYDQIVRQRRAVRTASGPPGNPGVAVLRSSNRGGGTGEPERSGCFVCGKRSGLALLARRSSS
jgi:hypothetical protein